jgi:hypothetical protein
MASPDSGDAPQFPLLGWLQGVAMVTIAIGLFVSSFFEGGDDGFIAEAGSIDPTGQG